MKSTGIVRKIDDLGRVVLPVELRRSLNLNVKDPVEVFVDGDQIIMRKYKAEKACFITGEVREDNVLLPGGMYVSPKGQEILQEYLHTNTSEQ